MNHKCKGSIYCRLQSRKKVWSQLLVVWPMRPMIHIEPTCAYVQFDLYSVVYIYSYIYFDDCGTGKTINKHVNDGCANEKILHIYIYYIDPPICVITFLFKIISWKKDWDETWPLSLISQTFMAEATTTIAASHASRPRPKSWS